MAGDSQPLDAATRTALRQLADIAVPPEVSYLPQTWGWAALGLVLLAAITWTLLLWRRRHEARRYRREALAALALIEARFADDAGRAAAVADVPPLVKRVALAAWPRPAVAPLSGAQWVAFLRSSAGDRFPDEAACVFDDAEYRSPAGLTMTAEEARTFAAAVRRWIEGHRVSA